MLINEDNISYINITDTRDKVYGIAYVKKGFKAQLHFHKEPEVYYFIYGKITVCGSSCFGYTHLIFFWATSLNILHSSLNILGMSLNIFWTSLNIQSLSLTIFDFLLTTKW